MPGQKCTHPAVERVYNEVTKRWDAVRDPVTGEPVTRPCKSWAMAGTDKCLAHADAAQRRISDVRKEGAYIRKHRGEIAEMMSDLDLPEMHPMDGLLECVRWSGAMARSMAILVGELPVEPEVVRSEVGDAIGHQPGLWGFNHLGEQAPHVLVGLHQAWHDRYLRACKMALDAGIDERIVRNAEATSATLLGAFNRALSSVTLTEDQRAQLGRALAREVRAHVGSIPAVEAREVTPSTSAAAARARSLYNADASDQDGDDDFDPDRDGDQDE